MKIFNYHWASSHKVLYYCYSTFMAALVFMASKVLIDSLFEWAIVIPTSAKEWLALFISSIPFGFALTYFNYLTMKRNFNRGKQQ